MDLNEMAAALLRVDLFRNLDRESLRELAAVTEDRHLTHGELLYSQGAAAGELVVLAEGAVALSVDRGDGDEAVVATLHPPAAFGEAALFDEGPRMVSARAAQNAEVLVVPGERFRELVRNNPDVAEALLRHMASVIRRSTLR